MVARPTASVSKKNTKAVWRMNTGMVRKPIEICVEMRVAIRMLSVHLMIMVCQNASDGKHLPQKQFLYHAKKIVG